MSPREANHSKSQNFRQNTELRAWHRVTTTAPRVLPGRKGVSSLISKSQTQNLQAVARVHGRTGRAGLRNSSVFIASGSACCLPLFIFYSTVHQHFGLGPICILKVFEDPKEILSIWVSSMDIYCI